MEKLTIDLIEWGLRGNKIDDLVDGWSFRIDEVSPYVFKVDGEDKIGHHVSSIGTDPEQVIKSSLRNAQRISSRKSLLDTIRALVLKFLEW
jgi:hypothetical protein